MFGSAFRLMDCKNLLQNLRHFRDQGGLEFEQTADDLFDFFAAQRINVEFGFYRFGEKILSFSVSLKALRSSCTRSWVFQVAKRRGG